MDGAWYFSEFQAVKSNLPTFENALMLNLLFEQFN